MATAGEILALLAFMQEVFPATRAISAAAQRQAETFKAQGIQDYYSQNLMLGIMICIEMPMEVLDLHRLNSYL